MSGRQLGLFIRLAPGKEWVWEGWWNGPDAAHLFYNTVEAQHPEAEAIWMDPDSVFDSMTRKKDDFDD